MWQVLLAAAAAAGSGILVKKFMHPNESEKPIFGFKQNDQECDQNRSLQPPDSIFLSDAAFQEERNAASDDGNIFRFSSAQSGPKELKKKTGSGIRGLGGAKRGKKSGSMKGGEIERGKKISVCLKKRRTGKHAAGKCESCASKDNSFGWGIGVGIMYMMSAGKAEISRLNSAMDETGKMVQELKAEISRRKSICNVDAFVAENETETNERHIEGRYSESSFTKPVGKSKNKITKCGPSLIVEGECASSILVEDQQPEVLQMYRLEAELESELQKLPWCATGSSGSEGRPDVCETAVLVREHQSGDCWNSNLHQYDGVSPAELDQKLCQLLIEQQGSQIVDLEVELHQANSELREKEAELQALKNCVKRLSEFSLASVSDEETEDKAEDAKARDGIEAKLHSEPTKSIVGMKRTMGDNSPACWPE